MITEVGVSGSGLYLHLFCKNKLLEPGVSKTWPHSIRSMGCWASQAQRKHPAGGWLHTPRATKPALFVHSMTLLENRFPPGSWDSYAFLAIQLHDDIAQGLENCQKCSIWKHLIGETPADSSKHDFSIRKAVGDFSELRLALTSATTRRPLTCAVVSLVASMHLCVRNAKLFEFSGLNRVVLLSHHFLPTSHRCNRKQIESTEIHKCIYL